MKKILTAILVLMPIMANAYDVEVGGIYYNLIPKAKIAEVTEGYLYDSARDVSTRVFYEGDIVIPESIEVEGINYSVEKISERAFDGCVNLTSVSLHDGIKTIGMAAFVGCTSLTALVIPKGVESIGDFPVASCPNMESIIVDEDNPNYDSRNNCNAIIQTSTNTLIDGCKNTVIPNGVEKINQYALWGCDGLEELLIPTSVSFIGESALSGCKKLKVIKFEECESLSLGNYVFSSSDIKEVILPDGINAIGKWCFSDCHQLETISIGSGISAINMAFTNCEKIMDVYCHSNNVPYTSADAFASSYTEYATLHVPEQSIHAYEAASPWSNFGKIVALNQIPKEKCTTPTITYINGKLSFQCETEGAEFVAAITNDDIKTHYGSEIELTATYTVNVYATAIGYENSDIATATLCWLDAVPKTEGMTSDIATSRGSAILICSNHNTINVTGADSGSIINVFDLEGKLRGSAISVNKTIPVTINTNLHSNDIAIIKIGSKNIKIIMK